MFSKNYTLWFQEVLVISLMSVVFVVPTSGNEYAHYTPPLIGWIESDTQKTALSAGDSRTTIGLKEKVDCSIDSETWNDADCDISEDEIVYDSIGTKTWWSSGSAGSVSPTTGNSTVMTADDDPGDVTVFVTVYDLEDKYSDGESVTRGLPFTVIAPDDEDTEVIGWHTTDPTILRFGARLTPTTVSFGNLHVEEQTGTGSFDFCWFEGSKYDPWVTVSGGSVPVNDGNYWSADEVGWYPKPIKYYRTHPAYPSAPCSTIIAQDMHVVEGSSGRYTINALTASIGTTIIETSRDGASDWKTWP